MNFRIAFSLSASSAKSAVNSLAEEELVAVVSANADKSRDSVFQHATRLRQSILQKAFTGERP